MPELSWKPPWFNLQDTFTSLQFTLETSNLFSRNSLAYLPLSANSSSKKLTRELYLPADIWHCNTSMNCPNTMSELTSILWKPPWHSLLAWISLSNFIKIRDKASPYSTDTSVSISYLAWLVITGLNITDDITSGKYFPQ